MKTLTKLLLVRVDLYWVKPGQTGRTLLKGKTSKGQIPWCSQTGQAATGQEESIIQRKAAEAQLSLKNLYASFLCYRVGREAPPPHPTPQLPCLARSCKRNALSFQIFYEIVSNSVSACVSGNSKGVRNACYLHKTANFLHKFL